MQRFLTEHPYKDSFLLSISRLHERMKIKKNRCQHLVFLTLQKNFSAAKDFISKPLLTSAAESFIPDSRCYLRYSQPALAHEKHT